MWMIFATIIILIIMSFIRKNSFDSIFVTLSLFYMILFFVFPLYILEEFDGVSYLGSALELRSEDYPRLFGSVVLFLCGFFLSRFVGLSFKKPRASQFHQISNSASLNTAGVEQSLKIAFWVFLAFVLVNIFVDVLDADRANQGYRVRRGEDSGNRVLFLFSIAFEALSIAVLFVAMAAKKHKIIIVLAGLKLFLLLTAATGRGGLLVYLSVILIYFANIKANKFILMSFLLVPILLPILVNLKSVIYSIAVLREFPDIIELYVSEVPVHALMGNFGHPLVSLLRIDEIINLVGYRYFYDYLQGFLFYLKMLGIDGGASLTYYNTQVLLGEKQSIVPTGYLAFGFIQLGYVGVFVSGVFYSFVGNIAEYAYKQFGNIGTDAPKFYFANAAAYTFYIGEVRTMVVGFLLPLIVVVISSRRMLK